MQWMRAHKVKTVVLILLLFVLFEIATIPFFSIARLRNENPVETALMVQRQREAEDAGKPLKITKKWIPLSRIPKHVVDAIIVAEDGTFYSHGGIDWFEVRESVQKNIDKRRFARGASTITQQLAKNLYLSTSKDPVRKLKEVIITLLLEHYLSKGRILEVYLNVIEWGRGTFGIEAAAQRYFGKSAANLTLDEGLRLAAVIPSPLRHRPDEDSRYVTRMKQIVLLRMQARNLARQDHQEETPSAEEMEREAAALDTLERLDTVETEEPSIPDSTEHGKERHGL